MIVYIFYLVIIRINILLENSLIQHFKTCSTAPLVILKFALINKNVGLRRRKQAWYKGNKPGHHLCR